MKKLMIGLLLLLLTCCPAWAEEAPKAPLTSWGAINQPITRPANWVRLVEDSPFALGQAAPWADNESMLIQSYGGYPSMDGSTVCVPLAMELARQHLDVNEDDLSGFVTFSTTHYAYERLIGRQPNPTVTLASRNTMLDPVWPVDLFLGTQPSDEEWAMAQEARVELVLTPICYDAFVFLVNGQNPVKNLSVQNIQDIYGGLITDWGQVGGEKGINILAYQRAKNSGSQTAMEQLVMQGKQLAAAKENFVSDGMGDLVTAIGDYANGPYSLGYSYLYYVEQLYKSGEVKVLSVNGVAPTADNLRSKKYPFTTCYYAVYRKGDEQTAAFVSWLSSPVGQQVVAQAGYIPYKKP